MLLGFPALKKLDISVNHLLVLPVKTLVSTCRLQHIDLRMNMWDCNQCENLRAWFYLKNNSVNVVTYFFCRPTYSPGCYRITVAENLEKQLCEVKSITEKVVPRSLWYYVGIVGIMVVAIAFISVCIYIVAYVIKMIQQASPSEGGAEEIEMEEL